MTELKLTDKWVLRLLNEPSRDSMDYETLKRIVKYEMENIETGKTIEIENTMPAIMLGEILKEVFYNRNAIVKLLKCLVDISGGYNIRINEKMFILDGDVIITIRTDNMDDTLLNVRKDYEGAAYLVKIDYVYEPIIIAGEILKEVMNQLFMSYIKDRAMSRWEAKDSISVQLSMLTDGDISGAIGALDNLRMDFNDCEEEEDCRSYEHMMAILNGRNDEAEYEEEDIWDTIDKEEDDWEEKYEEEEQWDDDEWEPVDNEEQWNDDEWGPVDNEEQWDDGEWEPVDNEEESEWEETEWEEPEETKWEEPEWEEPEETKWEEPEWNNINTSGLFGEPTEQESNWSSFDSLFDGFTEPKEHEDSINWDLNRPDWEESVETPDFECFEFDLAETNKEGSEESLDWNNLMSNAMENEEPEYFEDDFEDDFEDSTDTDDMNRAEEFAKALIELLNSYHVKFE